MYGDRRTYAICIYTLCTLHSALSLSLLLITYSSANCQLPATQAQPLGFSFSFSCHTHFFTSASAVCVLCSEILLREQGGAAGPEVVPVPVPYLDSELLSNCGLNGVIVSQTVCLLNHVSTHTATACHIFRDTPRETQRRGKPPAVLVNIKTGLISALCPVGLPTAQYHPSHAPLEVATLPGSRGPPKLGPAIIA